MTLTMVKAMARYRRQTEEERAAALRRMTYREAATILERLLRSRLVFELHFADDDHPVALRYHRRRSR